MFTDKKKGKIAEFHWNQSRAHNKNISDLILKVSIQWYVYTTEVVTQVWYSSDVTLHLQEVYSQVQAFNSRACY